MKKMTKFDMKSKTKFCVIIFKIINDYFTTKSSPSVPKDTQQSSANCKA